MDFFERIMHEADKQVWGEGAALADASVLSMPITAGALYFYGKLGSEYKARTTLIYRGGKAKLSRAQNNSSCNTLSNAFAQSRKPNEVLH